MGRVLGTSPFDGSSTFAAPLYMVLDHVVKVAEQTYEYTYHHVPGGGIVLRYIQRSYQNDPFRIVLEVMLAFFAVYYLLRSRKMAHSRLVGTLQLTPKEVTELCEEWEPEALAPPLNPLAKLNQSSTPTITSFALAFSLTMRRGKNTNQRKGRRIATKVTLEDKSELVNFASFNAAGLVDNESVREKAVAALRVYGVGACGPPGFYGTMG